MSVANKKDDSHQYGLKYSVRVNGGAVTTVKWYSTGPERQGAITEIKNRTKGNLISIRRMGR